MLIAIHSHQFLPPTFQKKPQVLSRFWLVVLLAIVAVALPASVLGAPVLEWNQNPESDIAGYVVYLGTTNGEYSTIQDVGKVTSYDLSQLSASTTYVCALQAYNSSGLISDLSPELSFTLQSGTSSISAWASAAGLTGASALPAAMPFHDGVCNLLKYASNMNAGGPDIRRLNQGTGTAGLPVFTLDRSGPETFTVEFLRRKASGLVYTPKRSTNLGSFVPMTGTPTVTGIDATWERVVVKETVNTSATPRLFGIVEVTMP